MTEPGLQGAALAPAFVAALAAVPAEAWSAWARQFPASAEPALSYSLAVAFPIPACKGIGAVCVIESVSGGEPPTLRQAALRIWQGSGPSNVRVLHQAVAPDQSPLWTIASAWADPGACAWLLGALAESASLSAEGWEWLATAERIEVSNAASETARQIIGRRHDVVLFESGTAAVVYARLTQGGQREVELLRHLERVPGLLIAPPLLGSAVVRAPDGKRFASAILVDIQPGSATVRSVVVRRLRRAFEGDPSLLATALDDVRAAGGIARELHAALGRPVEHAVIVGAHPATVADLDVWVARSRRALASARDALDPGIPLHGALGGLLDVVPGKLEQCAVAAATAPGLAHRIHGNLQLDTILITPPRTLSVVEFDGDPFLPDNERDAPQSPWRDVARLLVSIAEAAAEAAGAAGGDEKALEIAWLWEREARNACLEGYGSGGGALHALLAIFEVEFAARLLLDAVAAGGSPAVAAHSLQRLARTVV